MGLEKSVMDKINILEAIFIGTAVATFLLNTRRVLQAIESFKECLILLNSKALKKKHKEFVQSTYITVSLKMLKGYNLINDRQREGDVAFRLAQMYQLQSKYEEANEMYTKALSIMIKTGERFGEAECYVHLGAMSRSLGHYGKAEEYLEKGLVICKEIGYKNVEATCYEGLGTVYRSLGEYSKAKEYLEKALVISKEIDDKEGEATCYGNLGNVFLSLGKHDQAEEYLKKVLANRKEIGDREGEAICYGNLGCVFQDLGKYGQAGEYQNKALVIRKEIGDRIGEAACYINLCSICHSLGKYNEAVEYQKKALVISKEIGDKRGEATCYEELYSLCQSLGKYSEAEEYQNKALMIRKEIGDRRGEAACYRKLGTLLQSLGKCGKAAEHHNNALVISKEIGDKKGEASCYKHLGGVFESVSEFGKAKKCQNKALVIMKEFGDREGEANCFINLGVVFQSIGKYGKAKEHHSKALVIAKKIDDREVEAACYGNLGIVCQYLGDYGKAEEYQKKALMISQDIGNRNVEASCYGNLGSVFFHFGEYGKAEEHQNKALAIRKEIGHRQGEASCYRSLGNIFLCLGEHFKALEYQKKSLAISEEIGDRQGKANCYGNLGGVFCSLGKYDEAEEYQKKALAIRKEIGDRQGEADCYGNLGTVFLSLREYGKAEEYLEKAITIRKEIGDEGGEAKCCGNLGHVFHFRGEYAKAEDYHKKALSISEKTGDMLTQLESHLFLALVVLRDGSIAQRNEVFSHLLASIHKCEKMRSFLRNKDQFKISFLEQYVDSYRFLSVLFSSCGHFNEALYVVELGRARALGDLMLAQYHVKQQISDNPQSWVGIEDIINKEINCNCLYISYFGFLMFMWVLKANKPILFRVIDVNGCFVGKRLERNVDEIFSDETFRNFQVLPQDHCEDRSLPASYAVHRQPKSSKEEDIADLRLLEKEEGEDQRPPPTLAECYKMIIAPVVDLLEEPEIIIVPDRSLYKIPFAALSNENEKYLSETCKTRIVPSLSTLKLIQDSSADYHSQVGALIVGDPYVGTVIYRGNMETISSLPCARREAEMIGRLLGVQPLMGKQATKQAVLQSIHSVSLIHFAAHGDAERGEIALAPLASINVHPQEEDYLLTMHDISQVQLRAKLVVLSCCHSARGAIKAEGVVGIARAFLGSGARSVLVALWAISDSATEQLMSRFYEHLLCGESASESLYEAMKWMRSNGYSHVREWAPFMLIGDNVAFDFSK